MTESAPARAKRIWRESRAKIEGGSPDAIRIAACQLEELTSDPGISDRSRPYVLYDAGVALAHLLESDSSAPGRALDCETRATQMFKDRLIGGDASAAEGWVDALCALTSVCARAAGVLGLRPLSSAWLEVDVARDLLGGTPHWTRLGTAYSNLGIGLSSIHIAQQRGQRDTSTRDRAVRAFDTAIEMFRSTSGTALEEEHLVASVNRCICMSFDVTSEAEVSQVADCCVATFEWLISVERTDGAVRGFRLGARCIVLEAMQRALRGFLSRGIGELRLATARTAGSRLLLLAHPELWSPMGAPFIDPCEVEGQDGSPIAFILSVEGNYLEAALAEADESMAASTIAATWPAPLPFAVIAVMERLGRDEEPWVQQLVISLCGRLERDSAGAPYPSEQLAERFGKFTAWWCSRPEVPIEEMKSLREAFIADLEASPRERFHRVSVMVEAAANSAWRWSGAEVEGLFQLVRPWMTEAEMDREQRMRWARAKLRLVGRVAEFRPDARQRMRSEARAIRAMLVTGGSPDADALDVYRDAIVGEASVVREVGREKGADALSAAADALHSEIAEDLAGWGVPPEATEQLLAAVTGKIEIDLESIEDAALAFEESVADGTDVDHGRAWRLLSLIAVKGGDLEQGTVASAEAAIRLILYGASSRPVHPKVLPLFLTLGKHPQFSLAMRDILNVLDLGLRFAQEDDAADLDQLLHFSLAAEDYERSAHDRLQRMRASERIARFVFSSRQKLSRISPSICGAFLARQALDAEPARGAALIDHRGRISVAIAALIAACAGDNASALAVSLWSIADQTRQYNPDAAPPLYAALAEYKDSLTPSELPDSARRAINADIAMFLVNGDESEVPNSAGPWNRQSAFIWRATRFYRVRADGEFEDAELWREIDQFVADVQDSDEAEEDRAAWILGAAQAASMLRRRDSAIDEPVARRLAEAALAAARSPRVPQSSVGLPLLELTVLLGVLIGDEELARAALISYRAVVNQRILMSPSFATTLDGVPTLGVIDEATTEALNRRLGIALEIAESGRAKLLTAIAAGLLPIVDEPEVGDAPVVPTVDGLDDLAGRLLGESAADPLGATEEFLQDVSWIDAVASLVVPWRSLSHVEELDRLSQAGNPEVVREIRRLALADPDVGELLDLANTGRTPMWALGDLGNPRVVMLLGDGTLLLGDGDAREPPDYARLDPDLRAGLWRQLPTATRSAFSLSASNDRHRLPHRARTVVIDCAADPRVALHVANGVALASTEGTIPPIVPSARLLRARKPIERDEPSRDATVLANPAGDLPGSLLEAAAWSARGDVAPRLLMQRDATVEAFLGALCSSRLVVLAAHGRADQRAGAALRLADGDVSVEQLLQLGDAIVTEKVILSCCWGGARSTWVFRREALGVVSCLLALGVDEVIAPVEAVPDLSTGIFGAGLARAYRPAAKVGETLRQARLDLARISPEVRVADGLKWIRAGISSGAVVAADAAQVERAVAGLRQTTPAEVAHAGLSFGVFGIDGPPGDSPLPSNLGPRNEGRHTSTV